MLKKDQPQEIISQTKKQLEIKSDNLDLQSIKSNLDFLTFNSDDKYFSTLSSIVKGNIKDSPELAIVELHTFTVKALEEICDDNQIQYPKKVALFKLFGKYLESKEGTEFEIPEQVSRLASCILEEFNKIRNERSFAHDNKLLKKDEALFICKSVINLLTFLNKIEKPKDCSGI